MLETIETGKYYHIYNCGINGIHLFTSDDNYLYFMKLYGKYIDNIAETYAWCLMPNHFHVLLRIKENEEIYNNVFNPERVLNPFRVKNHEEKIRKHVTQQFSNIFNSYAQAFNKRNNRHGSLFERPFKRKLIDNETYLTTLVTYIHNNPVHHGFTRHASQWPWSSYNTCLNNKATKLKRSRVLRWFNDVDNFKYVHEQHAQKIRINEKLKLE